MIVGRGEWHWAHFVFEGGEEITAYIDGEQRAKFGTGVEWNKKHDMSLHAIYRAYDRALSADDIRNNVRGSFAVEPTDKLTTTWGNVKRGF